MMWSNDPMSAVEVMEEQGSPLTLPSASFRPEPRFRWPGKARCAVVLCFDVDGETTALEQDPSLRDRLTTWSQCTYGPRVGVPRLLELLTHLEIPATFFIPGY